MIDHLSKHDEKAYEMTQKLTVARFIEDAIIQLEESKIPYEEGNGLNEVNRDIANKNSGIEYAIKSIEYMYEELIYNESPYTWESTNDITKETFDSFIASYRAFGKYKDSTELNKLKTEFKEIFGLEISSVESLLKNN